MPPAGGFFSIPGFGKCEVYFEVCGMGKERTIMIFPEFGNISEIDNIRKQYDPLSPLVRPHITLVFPFQSEFCREEIDSLLDTALSNEKAFHLRMHGFSCAAERFGNYLFLNVIEGYENILRMNALLYSGWLSPYKRTVMYRPHMTVGKLPSIGLMDKAFQNIKDNDVQFETVIEKVSVETIGEHGESIIETEYRL
jgi:2'-5' RNA ligase